MLTYPLRYFRYRRKLKFLEKEFARQHLLATVPKSNALIETYRDELARTARSLYENPPIKIHGQERS